MDGRQSPRHFTNISAEIGQFSLAWAESAGDFITYFEHTLFIQRIQMTHRFLIETTEELTEGQFSWVPGPHAPPIGWHLWHIARWADRMQACLPTKDAATSKELWENEDFILGWGIDPSNLGQLQTGAGMDSPAAAEFVRAVGQMRHLA